MAKIREEDVCNQVHKVTVSLFRRVLVLLVIAAAGCAQESAAPTLAPTASPASPALPAEANPVAQGQAIFTGTGGCAACHTIQGLSGATGILGPDLTHIGTTAASRMPSLSAEEYIRESIENPSGFVVEGFTPVMPELSGTMSQAELDGLVAFLLAQR